MPVTQLGRTTGRRSSLNPDKPETTVLQLKTKGESISTCKRQRREIIEAAIAGFEGQKQKIDGQIAELRDMLNGVGSNSAAQPNSDTRRRFGAATLKRMREAQQRRWAKVRGVSAPATPVTKSLKPKRKMSAAGRKAIAEAQRKRWAAKKAA